MEFGATSEYFRQGASQFVLVVEVSHFLPIQVELAVVGYADNKQPTIARTTIESGLLGQQGGREWSQKRLRVVSPALNNRAWTAVNQRVGSNTENKCHHHHTQAKNESAHIFLLFVFVQHIRRARLELVPACSM